MERLTSRLIAFLVASSAVILAQDASLDRHLDLHAFARSQPTLARPLRLLSSGSAVSQPPASYSYRTVNVPGAQSCILNGINNSGQIVGGFYMPTGNYAFVASEAGFRVVSYPGTYSTGLLRINDQGTTMGFYVSGESDVFFLWRSDGAFTDIAYPGAVFTYANGLNNRDEVVGTAYLNSHTISYLLSGAAYHEIALPVYLQARGINNLGDLLFDGVTTSFAYGAGTLLTIAVPGATRTTASDMNDLGQVVGNYRTETCGGAFLYGQGVYLAIDVPDSLPCSTLANGVNDSGVIVGYYNDVNRGGHGFIATPVTAQGHEE